MLNSNVLNISRTWYEIVKGNYSLGGGALEWHLRGHGVESHYLQLKMSHGHECLWLKL